VLPHLSSCLMTPFRISQESSAATGALDASATELSLADTDSTPRAELTSGGLLVRNVLWNFAGEGVPTLAAIIAIPVLIHALGAERFGAFTIVWTMVNYVGVLDLGLGRTMTKMIADELAAGSSEKIAPVFWTGFYMMALVGVLIGAVLAGLSPILVYRVFRVSPQFRPETLDAFLVLSATFPMLITNLGLRGLLGAFQRFDLISKVRIPGGTLIFIAPLAVLPFSRNLALLVAVLSFVRMLEWAANFYYCIAVFPPLRRNLAYATALVKPMLGFGGWVTVSQVVGGQVLVYSDRLLLGALASMSAVAYYATPFEMITKLRIIPGAIVGVLFPAFAESFARDRSRAVFLFDRGVKHSFIAVFPAVLIGATLAHEGLSLWVGRSFADHSALILQWLAIGLLTNSLGHTAFILVQAAHRPDLPAKLHLAEVPLYLPLMWLLISARGVEGAALAWTIRVTLDTAALFGIAWRLCPEISRSIRGTALLTAAGVILLASGGFLLDSLGARIAFLIVTLVAFAFLTWKLLLSADEKAQIYVTLRRA